MRGFFVQTYEEQKAFVSKLNMTFFMKTVRFTISTVLSRKQKPLLRMGRMRFM